MSTIDEVEVKRLGAIFQAVGAYPVDCPVSGACHLTATGNIAIFAGCDRAVFDWLLPMLTVRGRRVLYTRPPGWASVLKVVTNYLATANLIKLSEALITSKMAGMKLNLAYEVICISLGNSFFYETESQVILNRSREINFTFDLVVKDVGPFQKVANSAGMLLENSPKLTEIFKDGQDPYRPREWLPNIIKRFNQSRDVDILVPGFLTAMIYKEPEEPGHEVIPRAR